MFAALARLGAAGLVIAAAVGLYLWFTGIDVKEVAAQLPALVFYYSHSIYIVLAVLITSLLLGVISSRLIKEVPSPHERKAKEAFMKIGHLTSRLTSKYSPMLSKDIIDLVRSGIIFPVILTFLTPLLFLYTVTWFVESVMLWDVSFSVLFYAAMVGFLCTLLYSWLTNVDISECYNSLPLSMPHVIRTKLILFLFFTCFVAVPYLVVVGYLKGEMDLLLIGLFIMFTVSAYVGSVLAYLTGLFTSSYLLNAKILLQFTLAVVPVLLAETLLSFYYQFNSEFATLYIAGLGLILVAASKVFLSKLDSRWKGKMFGIA
jgi:MFS family permease